MPRLRDDELMDVLAGLDPVGDDAIASAEIPEPSTVMLGADRRRRWFGRRWRIVVPVLAAVPVLIAAIAYVMVDEPAQSVGTTDGQERADGALVADTEWQSAELSVDGTVLTIKVGSQPEGDGPCETRYQHEVTERSDRVVVAFDELDSAAETRESVACPLIKAAQTFEIELAEPLGDRPVFDGVVDQPRRVFRLAERGPAVPGVAPVPTTHAGPGPDEIVRLEVLPEGITADDVDDGPHFDEGEDGVRWLLHAMVPTGPGWDLMVDQMPAGSFTPPSTAPGEVIGTTQVHGHPATIYEYFNHTGHMIHWVEGGFDIVVRAELHTVNMNDPRSFANPQVIFIDDELLRVAEGVVVPPS